MKFDVEHTLLGQTSSLYTSWARSGRRSPPWLNPLEAVPLAGGIPLSTFPPPDVIEIAVYCNLYGWVILLGVGNR